MAGKQTLSRLESTPMPLITFHLVTNRYWKILLAEESSLESVHNLFANEKDIWPDQCKRALSILCRIEKPVQELHTLFKEYSSLPPYISEHRYTPLLLLQQSSEQVQALNTLISNFRTACRIGSQKVIRQRREIEQRLSTLVSSYKEAFHLSQSLSDQARFQERNTVLSSKY